MPLLKKFFILLTAGLFSAVIYAQKPLVIEGYGVDEVGVFDQQGNWVKDIASKKLPAPLVPTAYNSDLEMVEVDVNGERFWLDTMDLQLNQRASTSKTCSSLHPSARSESSRSGVSMGVSKLCTE